MVKYNLGKIPPQAIDVEEAILGALMLDADAVHKVAGIIDTQSFYKEEHRKIFDVIKSLSASDKPIDILTVTKALKDRKELDDVGGPIYVTQLTSHIASAAHIEHHARIIAQCHIQRELIRVGIEITTEAYDEGADIDELLNNLQQKVSFIGDISTVSNSGQTQSNVIDEAILEIEKDYQTIREGKSPGITTGFKRLDEATGGWRNTNFIIIAARPGVGKTSLALHFAKIAARSGKWVNFYGLEMKSSDLMRIMMSGESGINRTSLRDGRLDDRDWESLSRSIIPLNKLPIIWNDFAGITAAQIKSLTVRNRKVGKCDLIIIDYIQLITTSDKKQNREQQISEISWTLKKLGLSENIPVIALAQLNREAEGTKPQLHHMRESGSLEQDTDVVIFPWVEDGKYQLTVAKNRRGKKGTFEIYVNDEMTVFADEKSVNSEVYNPYENDNINNLL